MIQSNSAAAEEMASTSEELTAQASQLQDAISFFKVDDTGGQRHRASNIAAGGQRSSKTPLALPPAKKTKWANIGHGAKENSSSASGGAKIALDDKGNFERY